MFFLSLQLTNDLPDVAYFLSCSFHHHSLCNCHDIKAQQALVVLVEIRMNITGLPFCSIIVDFITVIVIA